ncbi:hypothetical protein ACFZB6_29975 [Streptomyces syringium]|uniref:hypothetical protein n=1 Tax=Streptomyces syringium TaxID=76729 RepID=UPI0033A59B93
MDIAVIVLREIVTDSRRTRNLILLVISVLLSAGALVTVALVLIPNPSAWLTVAGCCAGTTAVAAASRRRQPRASRRSSITGSSPRGVGPPSPSNEGEPSDTPG